MLAGVSLEAVDMDSGKHQLNYCLSVGRWGNHKASLDGHLLSISREEASFPAQGCPGRFEIQALQHLRRGNTGCFISQPTPCPAER